MKNQEALMKTFMRIMLPMVAVGLLCCGCSKDEIMGGATAEPAATVAVSVEAAPWIGVGDARQSRAERMADGAGRMATRAGGEMLSPVTLLVVPDGDDEIAKRITVTDGTNFNVSLANGTYDLVAVCGLPTENVPALFSNYINIPDATDFAVGKTSVTVKGGVCTPATVSIAAERQMAWLDVSLTGVPENIAKLNLYIGDLYETYSLDGGWVTTVAAQQKFTRIPVTKNGSSFEGGGIMFPCSNASGVVFVAEATTTGGTTMLLTYTSATPLSKGIHLTQTLEYGDMMVVEGGINLGDWTDKTDDGTLSGGFGFTVGQQYFSQAATVVHVYSDTKILSVLAHKPMTATIAEMRTWDTKHVAYTLSPEISVQRWAMPTSPTSPLNVMNAIQRVGWDAFDAQFRSNGLAPIDRTATNIIAYWDKAADKFYTYDFANNLYQEVTDESGEYLFYPLGIIQLSE